MKNKIFNLKLYFDGIKQLRVIGIMALIIYCFEAILMGIGNGISNLTIDGSEALGVPLITNLISVHPILVVSFLFLAPILTLYLFSFVNRRNSSDFYNSAPVSRTALYLNYLMAILTWLIVIIIISTIASFITSLFFSQYYVINVVSIFSTTFNILAGSFLIVGSISIAMCITGTVFTNIIVSGLIIFIPRILITFIVEILASSLPMLISGMFIPVLDVKYNVVCGWLFNFVVYSNGSSEALTSLSSGLYTFIMAIIYIFIALILFKKRKSESAGQSAPNNILQSFYRIIIALIITLIPIYTFFYLIVNKEELSPDIILVIISSYLGAIVISFIYELITTKRFKNLIKAIPGLGIVALLNVFILLSMLGIYNFSLNNTPDADEFDSVKILAPPGNYLDTGINEYFAKAVENLEISNNDINEILARTLKENVESFKASGTDYYGWNTENNYPIYVSIDKGLFSSNRIIYLNKEDFELLMTALKSEEDFVNIYTVLPDLGNNTTINLIDDMNLSDEAVEKIYETLNEEIKTISFDDWYGSFLNYETIYTNNKIVTTSGLNLTTTIGSQTYTTYLPISSLTPKTCAEFFNQIQESNSANIEEIYELAKTPDSFEYYDIYFYTINMFPELETSSQTNFNFHWYTEDDNNIDEEFLSEIPEGLDIIYSNKDTPISVDKPFMRIDVNCPNCNTGNYKYYTLYVAFEDQSQITRFGEILNNLGNPEQTGYQY